MTKVQTELLSVVWAKSYVQTPFQATELRNSSRISISFHGQKNLSLSIMISNISLPVIIFPPLFIQTKKNQQKTSNPEKISWEFVVGPSFSPSCTYLRSDTRTSSQQTGSCKNISEYKTKWLNVKLCNTRNFYCPIWLTDFYCQIWLTDFYCQIWLTDSKCFTHLKQISGTI